MLISSIVFILIAMVPIIFRFAAIVRILCVVFLCGLGLVYCLFGAKRAGHNACVHQQALTEDFRQGALQTAELAERSDLFIVAPIIVGLSILALVQRKQPQSITQA